MIQYDIITIGSLGTAWHVPFCLELAGQEGIIS